MWSEERKYVICYFAHSRCIRNILTAALTNLSVIPSVVLQMDITIFLKEMLLDLRDYGITLSLSVHQKQMCWKHKP